MTLTGKDASGKAFKENTRTVIVNKHGAKILTTHQLGLGGELTVENRSLGQVARANVVWLGEKRGPKDPYEFGIQLIEAQNIWGIEFPPDDWQEGQPLSSATQPWEKPAPAGPKAAEPPRPAKAAPKPEAPPPPPRVNEIPKAAPPAPLPGRPLPAQPPAEVTEEALARFNSQLEEVSNAQAKQFEQRLANLIRQIGQQTQASVQDSANAAQEKIAATLEEQVTALGARLEKARGELESLLAKLEEVQQKAQEEVTKSLRTIQDTGSEAVQYAVEDLTERARKELESSTEEMLEQVRKKLDEARAAKLDAIAKEVGERLDPLAKDLLAKSTGALQSEQARIVEQAKAQLSQAAQAATSEGGAKFQKEVQGISTSVRKETEKAVREQAWEIADTSLKQIQKLLFKSNLVFLVLIGLMIYHRLVGMVHFSHFGANRKKF